MESRGWEVVRRPVRCLKNLTMISLAHLITQAGKKLEQKLKVKQATPDVTNYTEPPENVDEPRERQQQPLETDSIKGGTEAAVVRKVEEDKKHIESVREYLDQIPVNYMYTFIKDLNKALQNNDTIEDPINISHIKMILLPHLPSLCLWRPDWVDGPGDWENTHIKCSGVLTNFMMFDVQEVDVYEQMNSLMLSLNCSEKSSLTSLHVDSLRLPPMLPDVIRNLPRLQSLILHVKEVDDDVYPHEISKLQDALCAKAPMLRGLQLQLNDVTVTTLRQLIELRCLNLEGCDVPDKDAAKLICELPHLEQFGWEDVNFVGEGHPLIHLYNTVATQCQHGNCFKKIKRWLGGVEMEALSEMNTDLLKLVGVSVNSLNSTVGGQQIEVKNMKGCFGVHKLVSPSYHINKLTQFLSCNGESITELTLGTRRACSSKTMLTVVFSCPYLEKLILLDGLDNQENTRNLKEELKAIIKPLRSLTSLDLVGMDLSSVYEQSPSVEFLHILLQNSENLNKLLLIQDGLTSASFQHIISKKLLHLKSMDVGGCMDRVKLKFNDFLFLMHQAPNLEKIIGLSEWKGVSRRQLKRIKELAVKGNWLLSVR